ncbi:MAG: ABC transporter ATP-binding protein/permease [Gammaproteobacteria bacterium]
MKNSVLKSNQTFLHDFWHLAKPYWASEEKWYALGLLTLNILFMIAGVKASLGLNEFYKEFVNALQKFNYHELSIALLHFAEFTLLAVIATGYAFYCNNLLSLRWRRWLTQHYLDRWLSNHHYHDINQQNNSIDNPDQRISEDLEHLPTKSLAIFFVVFDSCLRIATFGFLLWKLSIDLIFSIKSISFVIPGYLFFAGLLFGLTGPLITKWLAKKLAGLDYELEQCNADFRYSLIRCRESSEQIALSKGEKFENHNFQTRFKTIYNNFINIIKTRKRIEFFNSGYNNIGMIFGYLISLPIYMQRKITLGTLMQISGALGYFTDAFFKLISSYNLFTEWRAVIYRLNKFNESMNFSYDNAELKIIETKHHKIHIHNLTIKNIDGSILSNNINMKFLPGYSYLITGPASAGKSTLFRCIAGLWPYASGLIEIPKNANLLFIPQKNYLPTGTLKDILIYPNMQFFDTIMLENLLEVCQLKNLCSQLSTTKNWAQILSPSEQQLLNFARILLQKPQYVFLDQATSALNEHTESFMYETLKEFLPQICIISTGQRNNLLQIHDQVLELTLQIKESHFE